MVLCAVGNISWTLGDTRPASLRPDQLRKHGIAQTAGWVSFLLRVSGSAAGGAGATRRQHQHRPGLTSNSESVGHGPTSPRRQTTAVSRASASLTTVVPHLQGSMQSAFQKQLICARALPLPT